MCGAAKRILSSAVALAACAPAARQCLVGGDCVSGVCLADGSCALSGGGTSSGGASGTGGGGGPGGTSGAAGISGGSTGAAGTGSTGSAAAGGSSGGTGAPACDPAFGGTVARAQVPVGPGLSATFEVAIDAGFDTGGALQGDGGYLWDFTGPFPGDRAELVQTQAPSGEWFGSAYPSASYAAPLSDLSSDLGVFAADESSIDLVGLASPAQGSGETEVSYSPPVPVLSFPLQLGASWQTDATVSGTFEGFPDTTWLEDYVSSVDKLGNAVLPNGASFPVLRVRTDLVRTFGALVTTQRSYAFVTPCFGAIAAVFSHLDEPDVEFQNAAEVRRLAQP